MRLPFSWSVALNDTEWNASLKPAHYQVAAGVAGTAALAAVALARATLAAS